MKKTLVCTLLLSLGFTGLRAQTLPLDSILRTIDASHPALKMAEAQLKALDTYATGANSWEAPRVGTGFWMTPYNQTKAMEMNNGQRQGMVIVSVEQMIPNPAKQRANRDFLRSMSSVERENLAYQRNQLRAQAKMNYYEWGILKKKKRVLEDTEELLNFIIQSTEIRYPYGGEKLGEVYQAKAVLYRHHTMELMNDNEINEQRIALNTLMNRDKDLFFDVDTTYTLQHYDVSGDADTAAIGGYRSDLRAIDQTIQRTKLKQQLELSSRKPEFGIQYQHMNSLGNMPNQFTLMGVVTIPIAPWSSNMYKANVAGLAFETQALFYQRSALLNEVSGRLQILRSRISTKQSQMEMYEKGILPALEKNYRTTLLAYEQNTEQLKMVLDTWESLRMARLEALNQLQELLQLQVDYERETEK